MVDEKSNRRRYQYQNHLVHNSVYDIVESIVLRLERSNLEPDGYDLERLKAALDLGRRLGLLFDRYLG